MVHGCMNTVKHKPGLQLQYLLQGGSYRNTKLLPYNMTLLYIISHYNNIKNIIVLGTKFMFGIVKFGYPILYVRNNAKLNYITRCLEANSEMALNESQYLSLSLVVVIDDTNYMPKIAYIYYYKIFENTQYLNFESFQTL
ncbi:Uncharacterized protein FWK35_00014553 [Aphis craccivora]|uniref:Uncharacterized protein n=1 Tax=Aphis craccivora TaxID=307492 RepID=A0A6G0YSU8_APHCR|nr:Uncharacterized protein FWK35_00014553 [Aphis craccivora]